MKPTNRSAALGDLAIIAAVCGVALLYAIVVKGWHPSRFWPGAALEDARKAGVDVGHTAEEQQQRWLQNCSHAQPKAHTKAPDGLFDYCIDPQKAAAKDAAILAKIDECLQAMSRAEVEQGRKLTQTELRELCPWSR